MVIKEDSIIRQNVCLVNTIISDNLFVCFYNYFYKNGLYCKGYYYEVVTNIKNE